MATAGAEASTPTIQERRHEAAEKIGALLDGLPVQSEQEIQQEANAQARAIETGEPEESASPQQQSQPAEESAEPEQQPEEPEQRQEAQPEQQAQDESDSGSLQDEASKSEAGDDIPLTPDGLAHALETSTDSFYREFTVPYTDANGQRKEFTLEGVKDLVAKADRIEHENQAAKAARDAFESERKKAFEELQQRQALTGALLQHLEAATQQEFQGINWEQLKEDDPQRWSQQRIALSERQSGIEKAKQAWAAQWQETQAAQQQVLQASHNERLTQERQKLIERFPEWKDPDRYRADSVQIRSFLQNEGYTEQEINAGVMTRELSIIRDAMRYRALQKDGSPERKLVKNKPMTIKPGSKPQKVDPKIRRMREARAAVKKAQTFEQKARALGPALLDSLGIE